MRKLNNIILILVISIIGIINVKAALPDTITNVTKIDGTGVILNGYDSLPIKKSGSLAIFCTNFKNETYPNGSCTKITDTTNENYWNNNIKAGVAAIISKVGAVDVTATSSPANYYYGELAINEFLCAKGIKTEYTCVSDNRNTEEILGDHYSWYTAAVDAFDAYKAATISLSTSTLTFNLQGNNYVSNSITVTKSFDDGYNVVSNIGEVIQDGNKFKVSIPASSITSATTNVTVTVSISKNVNLAHNYFCGTGEQTVTPNEVATKKLSTSINAAGTIQQTKLTIIKLDENNARLSGVKIKVTGPNNYSEEFTTTSLDDIVIRDLALGTYTITEISSPGTYSILKTPATATISSNNMTPTVVLTNSLTETVISKVNAVNSKELSGAKLELLNNKKQKMSCIIFDENDNKKALEECTWTSTNKPTKIVGLTKGSKYFLKETIAPDGYVLNQDMVEFTVKDDGTVTQVKMENALNKVKISKLSAVNKKELPGATLEIQDEEGNIVEYCTDSDGNKNKECKWVSTKEPYEIEGMPNGVYYLIETNAPEGYVLYSEKVKFIVDGSTATVDVEMTNELEVEVPDTLSAKSALLMAVAMFDIALGIGIITYVKKNKIEE